MRNIFSRKPQQSHSFFNKINDIKKVEALADGSTMLGEMALENGLIDQIGGEFEVKEYLKNQIGEEIEICW